MSEQEGPIMLHEAIQKIKNLITQEKWVDAHRACLEILRFDPDNLKIIRLAAYIEKKVKVLNVKSLKKDLENLAPLWEEKRYEELLENLKQLTPYIKDYPPLKNLIRKAEDGYRKKVVADQEIYFDQEKKRIEELIKKESFQEALRDCEKLRLIKLHEEKLKSLIKYIKEQWIDSELTKNKALLESDKHENILLFFQSLKQIDGNSEKIKKMMNTAKKRYDQYKIDQKKDYIYQGLEKIRTLYQLKKFDKAEEGAKEILEIDPKNSMARSIYMRAKRKSGERVERDLIRQMTNSYRVMKEKQATQKNDDSIKI